MPTRETTSASARIITRTSPLDTILDFSGQGGFAGAVEMCSGVGACRKTEGGTMCPSYMVTHDEMHTTRGRANLLRLVMTGELSSRGQGFDNEVLHEALDLCLQCKACKTECPSKVDMAKLKAEVLHQQYQNRPHPLGHLLLGHIFRLNPIASATAPLANRMLHNRGVQVAARESGRHRPPAHAFRRSPAIISAAGFAGTFPPPVPARAGRSFCSTTVSRRTTSPKSASRRCRCWKPRVIAFSWPGSSAAVGRRSPRVCFRWHASWPGRTF